MVDRTAHGLPLLVDDFCAYLDVNESYLSQLPASHSRIVARVRLAAKVDCERRLFDAKQVQGAKFVLQAVHGWRERSDITSGDNPIRTIDAVVLALNAADRDTERLPYAPAPAPLLTAGIVDADDAAKG